MKEPGPYILTNDDDGHHYVIPKSRESDWERWVRSKEWELGQAPAYAEEVGGAPSLVTFPSYTIR
jgi:hypothetical protein